MLLLCLSLHRKRLGRHFFHFALMQPQNPMAPTCKRQVVRGNYRGQLVVPVQSRDQFKDQFAGAAVEVASRLIGQQHLRLGDERSCQRQPLLLAAGKLA